MRPTNLWPEALIAAGGVLLAIWLLARIIALG